MIKFNKSSFLVILLLLLVSVPSIFSLFHSGFFVTDDGEWMVIRFSAFYQAFADGQIPVRFLGRLNNGFGYPVANFLYPGFMYLGIPVHILGFSFVDTVKIILGISMVGSAIIAYFWLSKLFDKISSFIGAVIYLYLPYHLFDLYKRGSVGEILALAIVPFVLWQIERKSLFWSSVGIAFLILSHNTLAVLFLPIIFIYFIIRHAEFISASYGILKQVQNDVKCVIPFLFGFGLSSFFWIPAVFELQFTRFSQTQVADFKNYFAEINLIGLSSIIILLISIFFFYKVRPLKRSHLHERLIIFFLIIGVLSVFFSSELSNSLWSFLPSSFIQFPFRLLSVVILSVAFLSASIFSVLLFRNKIALGIILLILTFVSSLSFIKPSEFFDKGEGFYATNEGTTTVQNEYLPKWVKENPKEHFKDKIEIISGQGRIGNLVYNSKKISFVIRSDNDSKIRINTIYYPGWKALLNNQESVIDYNNDQGVMEVSVPKGNHNINLSFSETPIRLFADVLSILSFGILIIIMRFKPKLLINKPHS